MDRTLVIRYRTLSDASTLSIAGDLGAIRARILAYQQPRIELVAACDTKPGADKWAAANLPPSVKFFADPEDSPDTASVRSSLSKLFRRIGTNTIDTIIATISFLRIIESRSSLTFSIGYSGNQVTAKPVARRTVGYHLMS